MRLSIRSRENSEETSVIPAYPTSGQKKVGASGRVPSRTSVVTHAINSTKNSASATAIDTGTAATNSSSNTNVSRSSHGVLCTPLMLIAVVVILVMGSEVIFRGQSRAGLETVLEK